MNKNKVAFLILGSIFLLGLTVIGCKQKKEDLAVKAEIVKIENPVIKGHFADPSLIKNDGKYYVYATIDPWGGDELAVFESEDFINWERKKINWPTLEACQTELSTSSRVWAPGVIKANNKFYMYVSVGSEIWVGVSENPLGPWKNAKADNSPLIKGDMFPEYHMIDAEAFIDDDGTAYLYWGSGLNWKNGHCFIVPLNSDMVSFDEKNIKDITPPHYFEAPFMLKKNNKYFLMYSEGKCIDETYMVRYSVGDTPYGPWTEGENSPVLSTSKDATTLGPGHHTVFTENNQDYILYHRIKDNDDTLLREIAIDSLNFDSKGNKLTVIPQEGVTSFSKK
ncbi:family 43 glycosylhydrolase [Algibacter amylolyticus]|uniref:Family 43 glycosylhydrolase n=1 Tax=Algibacter amylolyticus TaxID=1608400 RepID=A0A5M7B2K0_9FLAO|nr:family 43 glycosylhydrolase [Algibacter amylolyticus]KAA5823682.1 family 43 glycosylhydrolase [Algibacter amylolyticus]MBB5267850.1 beta-xylosidase [Algibacter amylolyticus]TSJ74170.1 family 43 glycosylhydrolase [Algibacter amylolyticus]